jgi:hypothetical protein
MPARLVDLEVWGNNFQAQCAASPAGVGLTVPQAAEITLAYENFRDALLASTAPNSRTSVTIATTREMEGIFRAKVMEYVPLIQFAVGDVESTMNALGLTFRKTTKTPIAAPTAVPDLSIDRIEPLALVVRLKELGTLGNAMPDGSVGYEVASLVGLENPPNSPEDMPIVGTGSRRFYTLNFVTEDIGKQVSVAMRYVTAKGLRGPWSSILTTTVVSG